ncbi:hypothetical protein BH09MYX1_BH09MYX1_11290 [soil metagenome]
MSPRQLIAIGAFSLLGCGSASSPTDAGADAGSEAEAPWMTTCAASTGARVCGGYNACPTDKEDCGSCFRGLEPNNELGLCQPAHARLGYDGDICPAAVDGKICIAPFPSKPTELLVVADIEWGLLFKQNGAGARVRYADMSTFTGEPLPVPATCTTDVTMGRVCGGNCGGCNVGELCHGRSPLHPYGVCLPSAKSGCPNTKFPCLSSESCFIFTVQPDAQADADLAGYCLPTAECNDLATHLPGGGKCVGS